MVMVIDDEQPKIINQVSENQTRRTSTILNLIELLQITCGLRYKSDIDTDIEIQRYYSSAR